MSCVCWQAWGTAAVAGAREPTFHQEPSFPLLKGEEAALLGKRGSAAPTAEPRRHGVRRDHASVSLPTHSTQNRNPGSGSSTPRCHGTWRGPQRRAPWAGALTLTLRQPPTALEPTSTNQQEIERESQLKTTVRCHLAAVRTAVTKEEEDEEDGANSQARKEALAPARVSANRKGRGEAAGHLERASAELLCEPGPRSRGETATPSSSTAPCTTPTGATYPRPPGDGRVKNLAGPKEP